jgi:hypothetical protein
VIEAGGREVTEFEVGCCMWCQQLEKKGIFEFDVKLEWLKKECLDLTIVSWFGKSYWYYPHSFQMTHVGYYDTYHKYTNAHNRL